MIYYTTKSGNLGVSLDDGETIFNHAGRRMAVNSAWEETEAKWDDLTEACQKAAEAVEEFEYSKAASAQEEVEAKWQAKEEAKERKRIAAEKRAAWLKTPEGLAYLARKDSEMNKMMGEVCRLVGMDDMAKLYE